MYEVWIEKIEFPNASRPFVFEADSIEICLTDPPLPQADERIVIQRSDNPSRVSVRGSRVRLTRLEDSESILLSQLE